MMRSISAAVIPSGGAKAEARKAKNTPTTKIYGTNCTAISLILAFVNTQKAKGTMPTKVIAFSLDNKPIKKHIAAKIVHNIFPSFQARTEKYKAAKLPNKVIISSRPLIFATTSV